MSFLEWWDRRSLRRHARTRLEAQDRARFWLALWIVISSFVGIILVSVVMLYSRQNQDSAAQLIFTGVLPLLGTWVGGVIAFYFVRDNLRAGSETTLAAVKVATGWSEDSPISSIMVPVASIAPRADVPDETAAHALSLRELSARMKLANRGSLPILTNAGMALYVVHQADIYQYAQAVPSACEDLADTHNVGSLLADPALAAKVTAFIAVTAATTLARARLELKNTKAQDIFITTDGTKTGRVEGWLSATTLARAE